jgi:hypothetical protein
LGEDSKDHTLAIVAIVGLLGFFGLLAFLLTRQPQPSTMIVEETEKGWIIVEKPTETKTLIRESPWRLKKVGQEA